ncbi:hypothetical protein [Burkholderia sp. MBR-1]|uniref:hypothetical protein n=1 Tax=Burkholderia sp. MBR-1 TaxID=2732364 RepID=UPI0015EF1B1E|nr:hypothetical protein [Burkholderia sp. MBR-1]QMI49905.1 hypothetical protein MBR110_31085 [Burkholderia sp. MBR-1]
MSTEPRRHTPPLARIIADDHCDGCSRADLDCTCNDAACSSEYGVNFRHPGGGQENPFEDNYPFVEGAIEAGIDFLRANPEIESVVIFRLDLVNGEIANDVTVDYIDREDLRLRSI